MKSWKIATLVRELNLSVPTFYRYMKEGKIPKPKRNKLNNRPILDQDYVKTVKAICA